MKNNKVIVVGDDHSNTLGVLRQFGENGIYPYLFIISNDKYVATTKSKYISKSFICNNEANALLKIVYYFRNETEKPVIIATSDKMMAMIDSNQKYLKNFIIYNINNEAGKIIKYMDKFVQYDLFLKNDFNVAKSLVLTKPFEIDKSNFELSFPVIIKPLQSIDGKKSDIKIANDYSELLEDLRNYDSYSKLIIQEYIMFDYEYDMSGYIYDGKICIPGYVKKYRIWPKGRGSMTFGEMIKYDMYSSFVKKIENLFKSINYNGMFDIEFFEKNNELYINEINFRNSGLSNLYIDSFICYNWYKSCISEKYIPSKQIDMNYYVMDDNAELHQIFEKNISLKKHFGDKKKVKKFLCYDKKDKKASRTMFLMKFFNKMKINILINYFHKVMHKSDNLQLLQLNLSEKNYSMTQIENNYNCKKITKDEIDYFYPNSKEIRKEFKGNEINGIAIMDGDNIVGCGLIKKKGIKDRFLKIKNSNSYAICNMYVSENYRGNNIQLYVIQKLIKTFITDSDAKVYTVVCDYNIPSSKNFYKAGFTVCKEKKCIRFMKCTLNKFVV